MARNLVEGECGGSNSLMKLTTHFTQDKAFRQEALGSIVRPLTQAGHVASLPHHDELVGEFLSGQSVAMAPQTFHMGSLLQEMREIEEAEIAQAPLRGPAVVELAADVNWADEFLAAEHSTPEDVVTWEVEFNAMKQPHQEDIKWAAQYLDQAEAHRWTAEYDHQLLNDEAWTKEFEEQKTGLELKQEERELEAVAKELLGTITDPKINSSEFMKFVKKISDGEITIKDNQVVTKTTEEAAEDWVSDFNTAEGAKSLTERWAEEFSEFTASQTDADFWNKLQEHWQEADSNQGHPWLTEFEQTSIYDNYKFEEENPVKDHPGAFQEGLKCLEKGDIPNAVLFFEASVQQNSQHAEAWQYLGTSQAENEQEPAAIAALKKCLELTTDNLKAWQCLAVSYTNESMGSRACHALRSWLRHNPKYKDLVSADEALEPVTSSFMTSTEYENVRNLYLKAVQSTGPKDEVDADVQCNLGVLFNLSGEFDKAVDCFQAALLVRPKDALLWNKLGATLANSNRSEEAVDAYHNALHLSPGFIRSRYNLGIACINLNAHREAVEHFLAALNMQQKSRGPHTTSAQTHMSDNIWSTLRMTLSLIGRHDLYPLCDSKDVEALNSEFGMST